MDTNNNFTPSTEEKPVNLDKETGNTTNAGNNQVPPVSTTGYWILAIVTLFFGGCLFGILAIMNANKINKATSIEEQAKAQSHVVMWSVIGLLIAVFLFIIGLPQ